MKPYLMNEGDFTFLEWCLSKQKSPSYGDLHRCFPDATSEELDAMWEQILEEYEGG